MSSNIEGVIVAYNKGYRVVDGKVISPFTGKIRKVVIHERNGYKRARFNVAGRTSYHKFVVNVHQLAAYQKYGSMVFEEGIVVRHLDGNSLNNKDYNIDIGSHSDNAMDKFKKDRTEQAIIASTNIRKFSDIEMEAIRTSRNEGATYKDIMFEFDISSKGTLHYILNTNYVTKV